MFLEGSAHAVVDLWDVAAHHRNLKFTCRRCRHWRVLHAAALWHLFERKGWSGHLASVRHRMKCDVCWTALLERVRDPIVEIVDEEPTGAPLPLPSDLEWKQAARRRR